MPSEDRKRRVTPGRRGVVTVSLTRWRKFLSCQGGSLVGVVGKEEEPIEAIPGVLSRRKNQLRNFSKEKWKTVL